MHRILFVAFEGLQTLDLTGPAEVFAMANRLSGKRAYKLVFASPRGGDLRTTSGLEMRSRVLGVLRPERRDTIVVVGGPEAAIADAVADPRLVAWLRRAAGRARRIASVCSGAFLLAAAGVLDGRRAATHWSACEKLEAFRPAVEVDRSSIFVHDGNVWTSAGVTTGIDMALAMVEEDHGTSLADSVAARLVLYLRRPGFQTQFSSALVAQERGSNPFGPAIDWARANLREATPEALARKSGMSMRTFHRHCLGLLKTTPAKLVEKLRVEHARALISTTTLPSKALAAECGFGTVTRMKNAFERELGVAPRGYRLLFSHAK